MNKSENNKPMIISCNKRSTNHIERGKLGVNKGKQDNILKTREGSDELRKTSLYDDEGFARRMRANSLAKERMRWASASRGGTPGFAIIIKLGYIWSSFFNLALCANLVLEGEPRCALPTPKTE